MTKEELFTSIREVLVNDFAVDEAAIKPGARLFQDLDIDSIDAVDLLVHIKELTCKKIQPEQFKNVRTIDDVIEAITAL
jgi:acyl carrier protein